MMGTLPAFTVYHQYGDRDYSRFSGEESARAISSDKDVVSAPSDNLRTRNNGLLTKMLTKYVKVTKLAQALFATSRGSGGVG
jgi:hypothetical protein